MKRAADTRTRMTRGGEAGGGGRNDKQRDGRGAVHSAAAVVANAGASQSLATEGPERKRGRPRVANPLSPAERAKRYRDRKRQLERASPGVAKNSPVQQTGLTQRITQLESELAALKRSGKQAREARSEEMHARMRCAETRIGDLEGALEEVVRIATAGKRLPSHVLKGLVKLLAA